MLKKYKLGELVDVARGTSLSGDYYSTKGEYIRLTCGNFDYRNNCFKENTSKDNLFYTGAFKAEFLLEKGDIITPLTEQAIGLLGTHVFRKAENISRVRISHLLSAKQTELTRHFAII